MKRNKKRSALLRKITSLMMVMTMCLSCLTACGGDGTAETTTAAETETATTRSIWITCKGDDLIEKYGNTMKITISKAKDDVIKVEFQDMHVSYFGDNVLGTDGQTVYSGTYNNGKGTVYLSGAYIKVAGSRQRINMCFRFYSEYKATYTYTIL